MIVNFPIYLGSEIEFSPSFSPSLRLRPSVSLLRGSRRHQGLPFATRRVCLRLPQRRCARLAFRLKDGERLLDKKPRSYISSGSDSQITLSTVRPLPVASLGFPSVPGNLTAEDTRLSFPILTPVRARTHIHRYNLREAEARSILPVGVVQPRRSP